MQLHVLTNCQLKVKLDFDKYFIHIEIWQKTCKKSLETTF